MTNFDLFKTNELLKICFSTQIKRLITYVCNTLLYRNIVSGRIFELELQIPALNAKRYKDTDIKLKNKVSQFKELL